MEKKSKNKIPKIYFFLTLWGDEYIEYFVKYCIPSLLTDGNLKLLTPQDNKLIIASPINDWNKLNKYTIIKKLKKYSEIVHLEIQKKKKMKEIATIWVLVINLPQNYVLKTKL